MAKGEYDRPPSWLERQLREFLRRLFDQSLPDQPPSGLNIAVAIVALALIAGLVYLVWRIRPEGHLSKQNAGTSALVDSTMSAADYRNQAASLLGSGRLDEALISAYRAIVADMVRRTVLGRRPGDTAQEVASAIGLVFADHGGDIRRAADLFDRAAYSHKQGGDMLTTADDVAFVRSLDERLAAARPDHSAAKQATR